MVRYSRPALALAWALGASLASCLTPPAVLQGTHIDPVLAIGLYPEETERVEVPVADGEFLRGFFVPAGDGAPVVLHLLESSGSSASLWFHYEVLCRRLQGLGLASLLVDYTGVGASDGTCSPRNLARDANAMWHAAVARAGGDPSRVIVRGISIGTIAAALLLRDGAEPGVIILHGPVFADTAVRRFARRRHGAFVAWLAATLYADVADVDLALEVASYRSRLLVIVGREDFFLSNEERARLEEAVHAAGGEWHALTLGHAQGSIEAHALRVEELEFLVERFPPPHLDEEENDALLAAIVAEAGADAAAHFADPGARARLTELARLARRANPVLLAAVSLANEPQLASLRYLWMLEERGSLHRLPFEDLVEVVALDDPAGRLPIDTITMASLPGDMHDRFGLGGPAGHVDRIVNDVAFALAGEEALSSYSITIPWDRIEIVSDPRDLIARLRTAGVPEEALARVAVRTFLKAARIPERVRRTSDGRVVLEIMKNGTWRELDPTATQARFWGAGWVPQELGRRARALVAARDEDERALSPDSDNP